MTINATDHGRTSGDSARLRILFALTLFLGAFLLFAQQLILGRALLLAFGGVPAVWLTALVLYQLLLLAAYAAVQALARVSVAGMGAVLALFLAAGFAQPYLFPLAEAGPDIGVVAVALRLLAASGTSLFVLSMASPLMQELYSKTGQPDAADPYYLYGASNLGSLAGLLAVPLLLEPYLGMRVTEGLWQALYIVFAGLAIYCARAAGQAHAEHTLTSREKDAAIYRAAAGDRLPQLKWVGLAFLPAALSFAATSTLTNEIAALPLLTFIPLALYLLTYALAFGVSLPPAPALRRLAAAVAGIYIVFFIMGSHRLTETGALAAMLAAFFAAALACHKQLADLRPATCHLPRYYLMIALGGGLGGLVNLLAVPFLLPLPYEFFIFLILVLLLGLKDDAASLRRPQRRELKLGAVLAALAMLVALAFVPSPYMPFLPLALVAALALLVLWPVLLALFAAVAVLLTLHFTAPLLDVQRDFFGIKRVAEEEGSDGVIYRFLSHGTTLHGMQRVKPDISTEPQAYYAWASGLGDAFTVLKPASVAAVGMGAGSMACMPGRKASLTFYEIDPGMLRLASTYFTYILDCPPRAVVMGDARRTLGQSAELYDLIVLDAFTSDAIPAHLLTREAFVMYEHHLAPGGAILVHVSNRHLDFLPLLAGLAADRKWAAAFRRYDPGDTPGAIQSTYVMLSPDGAALHKIRKDARDWQDLPPEPRVLWTDDRINMMPILNY